MFIKAENTTIIGSNALKNTISIQHTVVKDRNFCFFFINKFSIEINNQSHFRSPLLVSSNKSPVSFVHIPGMDKKEPSFPDNICQGREGPAVPPCLLLDLKQPLLIRS